MTSAEWVFIAVTASTTLINAYMAFGVHGRINKLEQVLANRGVL